MKILHISTFDIEGGAAKAAYRLHRGLLALGEHSSMLVLSKKSDDHTVIKQNSLLTETLTRLHLLSKPDRLITHYYPLKGASISYSPAFFSVKNVLKKIEEINPDIVHLHWVHGGFMNENSIQKIKKPIVWSLHDMWAFTGGCHYDEDCGKYKVSCGACPILNSKKENDLSRWVFQRKTKLYNKSDNLTIIGLSKWLADCARQSTLLKNINITQLPNCIDTSLFKPADKHFVRRVLNLPQKKKLILFGALEATTDKRKGFHLLHPALKRISQTANNNDIEIIIFGASKPINPLDLGFTAHYMGKIYDEATLTLLYSAADVTIIPSMHENLSNTIMESLACGTPVVGFDIGGNKDMIDHKINGYLATAYQPESLAEGICWVISDNERWHALSSGAREKVEKNFSYNYVCKKYIQLYEELCQHNMPILSSSNMVR